jgi:hypothetical protein
MLRSHAIRLRFATQALQSADPHPPRQPTGPRARVRARWLAVCAFVVFVPLTGCGEVVGPKYPDPVIEEPKKDNEENDG